MSFPFYGKMWIATQQDLKDAILCEEVLKKLEPTMDRNFAHRLIGNLYARYLILCNNLSELYDQTLQPQKRPLIEKLMITTKQRWLEILKEMQHIEMSQFVFVDDALIELSLVPQNVQFLRPFYFPRKRDIECQTLLEQGIKVEEVLDEATLKIPAKFRIILTQEQLQEKRKKDEITKVVTLIKAHEKAKQARIIALNIREFPVEHKPKPHNVVQPLVYQYTHKPDQIPLHKFKRTVYKTDFFEPPVEIHDYDFYEPPEYRLNKSGQKILISKVAAPPRAKSEQEISDRLTSVERISIEDTQKSEAASSIQRCYRRFRIKKLVHKRRQKKMEVYGQLMKPIDVDQPNLKSIDEENQQKRRERKQEFDDALVRAIEDEKARILKFKSEVIMEDITDSIRAWFREFYNKAGDFDRYPEEFEGGTILVVKGDTMTVEEFIIEKKKTNAQKALEKAALKKEKKDKKAAEKKAKELEKKEEIKRMQAEQKVGPTWDFSKMKEWEALDSLESTFKDLIHEWQDIDELKNWNEAPIWDWVTIDAYADVHQELRKVVDNFMRVELEILRLALSRDTDTEYKKQPTKKERKRKKKKEKEVVDVYDGKSYEECFEDLKKINIIRKYTKKSLDEFVGDRNYAARDLRDRNKDPLQGYGDVRNLMQNWVLGTDYNIKSLCIAGPSKCGKKFLVEAICTEMNAVMFDISPPNITEIVDVPKLLNLVMNLARKFQPSVILVDGAHKPSIKRITEAIKHENPQKLGKYLSRYIVTQLTVEDAVMLIGTTSEPFNCNLGTLKSCYEKFLVFPSRLDYQTSVWAWQKGLELKRIYNFNASSLGEVTRNFTTGDILDSIDSYVDLRRRVMLSCKPLTCEELLENLITTKVPIDNKLAKQFDNFALSVDPYSSERLQTLARIQKDIDKENAAKAKRKEKAKEDAAKKAATNA